VICRVCALYPYVSTDASSLSFEQGAVIEVLAQLDSGWWDGWCNGKRGWFPSNYVQVIPDDPNDNIQNQHNNDDLLNDSSYLKEQRSDWILQTTEDGSEVYYYNTVTKEMRYSVPTDDPTYK
ncbi:SH3 domain-containing protein, partial [Phascolomyces articulosus]